MCDIVQDTSTQQGLFEGGKKAITGKAAAVPAWHVQTVAWPCSQAPSGADPAAAATIASAATRLYLTQWTRAWKFVCWRARQQWLHASVKAAHLLLHLLQCKTCRDPAQSIQPHPFLRGLPILPLTSLLLLEPYSLQEAETDNQQVSTGPVPWLISRSQTLLPDAPHDKRLEEH